ncbi:hypothetical protein H5410_009320 [Solanum commersonii]|uniref:Uncharacterized protein n=1 Tax=Solanum commersonii TaxID=4109 RepID=A0A9J6AHJ0_SOLCO|nr:hypothetical protein H5410_009320 [Solanum commersonii]
MVDSIYTGLFYYAFSALIWGYWKVNKAEVEAFGKDHGFVTYSLILPIMVNLYIQFKSGRCQVLVTQQKVHEQAWEKGIIIQLLYLPVFYFFSSLQTTNLSWNYAAYNVKIGVSAKHKTSQMWTPLLSCCSPSDIPVKDFCKMRSQTKL